MDRCRFILVLSGYLISSQCRNLMLALKLHALAVFLLFKEKAAISLS
jgi:hypothetical protein